MSKLLIRKKIRSGGFALIEFAIALPLLILLLCGLTTVGMKIFQLGRDQLANYVLEEEAQLVMERITHQARAARTVEIPSNNDNSIGFTYHTVLNHDYGTIYTENTIDDLWETQYFLTYARRVDGGNRIRTLYAKRKNDGVFSTPITGANSFGETQIVSLKFSELNRNVLHVTLEMESLATGKRIKLNTAVFMSACEKKTRLPHEE